MKGREIREFYLIFVRECKRDKEKKIEVYNIFL